MEKKKLKLMCYVGGILTVAFYLIFLLIAWFLFPNPASPLDHWLSDLGRFEVPADGGPVWRLISGEWKEFTDLGIPSIKNQGAIFYNLGSILTGVSMFFFFGGFLAFMNEDDNLSKLLTYALMGIGIVGGVFLILVGVFAEDGIFPGILTSASYQIHHLTTMIFFAMLVGIKILSGLWAWKHGLNRVVSIYAWVVIIFDLIVVITGNNYAWIEWTSVLLSLATVSIMAAALYLKDDSVKLKA